MAGIALVGSIVALAVTVLPAAAQQPGGSCAACHRDLPEERLASPARGFGDDIHGARGLHCTSCHGGDALAEAAAVAHRGMLARPPRARTSELCGRCHSNVEYMKRFNPDMRVDQVVRYRTSVHGQRLAEFRDERVATCVDCHTSHGIRPATDRRSTVHPLNVPDLCGACHADPEHMAPYAIPTDQLREYQESVHWRAVVAGGEGTAPVCNDCHGNHGAVPPGYVTVGRVCAGCHEQIGRYFSLSPHDTIFVRAGLPACATCHGNHRVLTADDIFLAVGDGGACGGSGCHTEADAGGRAAEAMRGLLDSLTAALQRADSILAAAELAGMLVEEAQFELAQGRNAIIMARAATHASRVDTVRSKVEDGLEVARAGFAHGEAAFRELRVRRQGLAVSAAVILVLIVGLVIKIRLIERSA